MIRIALLAALAAQGCAALKPVRGVPVENIAADYGVPSRSAKSTIDLSLLVQTKPDEYRVGPEDVLAVYIPGVLGTRDLADDKIGNAPPINQPQLQEDTPTIGFPLTVRSDGTLPLPQIGTLRVDGMTLGEVEAAILRRYTQESSVLNADQAQVTVSLVREREYEVLVVRQEASQGPVASQSNVVNVGRDRKGAARLVKLKAYRNDVLHALAADQDTDGLPGLDAENVIYVIRRRTNSAGWPECGLAPGEVLVEGPAYGGVVADPPRRRAGRLLGRFGRADGAAPEPVRSRSFRDAPYCDEFSCDGCDGCLPSSPDVWPSEAGDAAASPPIESMPPATAGGGLGGVSGGPSFDEMFLPPAGTHTADAPPTPRPTAEPKESDPEPRPAGESDASTTEEVRPRQAMPRIQPRTARALPAFPIRGAEPASPNAVRQLGHSDPAVRGQSARRASLLGRLDPFRRGPRPGGRSEADAAPPAALVLAAHSGPPAPPIEAIPPTWQEMLADFDPTIDNPHVVKIPVRLSPGERPCFSERDIILQDGDIVFVESRGTEVFYTGGLLGGGQYELPRDYDLRLIEAMSIAQGPQNVQQGRSAGGNTALNGDVTESGSRVIVLRTLPGGAKVPIEVDFYKAVTHPEEHNILIQPGDVILVQYTCAEAVYAFFQKNFLESSVFGFATGFVSAER